MAVFCSRCGKELSDNAAFCPECGAPVKGKSEARTDGAPTAASVPCTQSAGTSQSTNSDVLHNAAAQTATQDNSVSTAMFFGLDFVFALPFVGLIVCIVMAFAPQNETLKHFARAKLIWLIIGVVITVITVAVLAVLGLSLGDWIARGAYRIYY